jgi:hypothetical protein
VLIAAQVVDIVVLKYFLFCPPMPHGIHLGKQKRFLELTLIDNQVDNNCLKK